SIAPGMATVSGKVNGEDMAAKVVIEVSPGAANAAASTMETSRTWMTTDETATITVRLKDAYGNSLTAGGDDVELFADYGSLSSVTDEGDGTYTATFEPTTPGLVTITGTVNGDAIDSTVTIEVSVGAASPETSTITADPETIDTDETALITVQLKDAKHNNLTVGGPTVTLTADDGRELTVTDVGNGTYTASFSSTTAGTVTITGKVDGEQLASFVEVEVLPGPADAVQSTVETSASSITTDEFATMTATVRDTHGNPRYPGGDAVGLTTTHGTLSEVTDNGDGTYSANLSATTPGTATIAGSVNGVAMTDTVVIDVSVGAANATTSTMETSQTSMTPDDSATITVRLKDSHGNFLPTADDNVELSTDPGSLSSVTDEGNGTYTATFTAETPGTATITGTVNGVAMTDTVVIKVSVGRPDAGASTITAAPDTISTDDDDTALITVQVKDAKGNNLPQGGEHVVLETDHGRLTDVEDRGDGTYTAVFSADTPGTAVITGTLNGQPIGRSAQVTVIPGLPDPQRTAL